MSKHTQYVCDRCGSAITTTTPATDLAKAPSLFIVTGIDHAGDGDTDDTGQTADLCGNCCRETLRGLVARRDYALNTEILKWAKSKLR